MTIFQHLIDLFNANEYNLHYDVRESDKGRWGNVQLKIIKSDSNSLCVRAVVWPFPCCIAYQMRWWTQCMPSVRLYIVETDKAFQPLHIYRYDATVAFRSLQMTSVSRVHCHRTSRHHPFHPFVHIHPVLELRIVHDETWKKIGKFN